MKQDPENMQSDNAVSHLRGIRSFVLRQGHLSPAQRKAIDTLMPRWGVPYRAGKTDLNALFGRDKAKILEIGFGMGTATAEIARRLPEYDFLAVDVHSPGVGNLLKLIDAHDIANIRVLRHDAVEVVDNMLADESLYGVHIFFPDPWHKKRHHKRRLIQPAFIARLLPKIRRGGYVHVATDWQDYAEQILSVLTACEGLRNTVADYAARPDYRPETKFETRGKKLGHGVWDLVFERL